MIAGSIFVVAVVTMGIAICHRKKWKEKQLGALSAKRFFEFSCRNPPIGFHGKKISYFYLLL